MESIVIKKRFDSLVSQRKTLDDTLQIIQKFVVPHRGEFFKPLSDEGEVDWRRRDIFDSTAIDANETLASSMQGSLTSPSTKWFSLGFRQEELNQDQDAMEWVEECGNRIYQALIDSNFNLESAEFYLDLTSFGTAIIVEEAESETEWKGLDFQAAPIRDCYFEMNHKNNVLRFYRRYQWTPLQIIDKFGNKTSDLIKEKAKATDSNNTKFCVIFCVYERGDKKDNIDSDKVLSPQERPYGWSWVLHKDGSQLGDVGGYYEMPAFVSRWRKTSGSQWGYSPAHICLSDILTLNQLKQEILEALGKVVDPSTVVTERNLMSDLDLGRGGLTVVKNLDDIQAYESKARFDVSELKVRELQEAINTAYRVDQLQMKESPAMTATEVNVRYELMQRLLGPTLGRLQADYLDPLINRTFRILMRAKQLPEVPEVVREMAGELDVEYVGPLPRAQRQEVVQATNQWIGGIAGLIEMFPELRDLPDIDMIGRETAKMAGLPAKYLNSDAKVKQIRQDRAEQEQRMVEIQQEEMEGKAMEAQGRGAQAVGEAMLGGITDVQS